MDFSLILLEKSPVPFHAIIAIGAIILGAVQLLAIKGTQSHKILGYTWVSMIFCVAFSSLFIHDMRWFGPFGPIHILSVLVFYTLWRSITAIREGNVHTHQKAMKALYFQALILAGVFTMLPGRVMHEIIFGI